MEWRWEAATRDGATGLPNAAIFRDRLAQALEHARRRGHPVCVVVAGVDNPDAGDLARTGARLAGAIRASDTVARFGEADLALLRPRLGDPEDIETVLERLRRRTRGSVSGFGYAVAPEDAADPESLLFVAMRRREDAPSLLAV